MGEPDAATHREAGTQLVFQIAVYGSAPSSNPSIGRNHSLVGRIDPDQFGEGRSCTGGMRADRRSLKIIEPTTIGQAYAARRFNPEFLAELPLTVVPVDPIVIARAEIIVLE